MKTYCFGIDVGGTSVKCGLFHTDGTLVEKWEIPTRTENNGQRWNWNSRTDQLQRRGSMCGKPLLGIYAGSADFR